MAVSSIFFAASFGGVRMLVSSLETERGRDIAVHSPARGDVHVLSDQGKRLRRVSAEIQFIDEPGQADYMDRYAAFVQLFEDGKPHTLSHPFDGSYVARGETMTVSGDSSALCVRLSVTFLEEQELPAVDEPAAGVAPTAGLESVSTAADRATAALVDFDLEPSVIRDVVSSATSWTEAEDLDSQEVFLGVASLTDRIDQAVAELELLDDLERWPAYREMMLLRYELVRAAQALTSASAALVEVFVDQPRPVIAICAEIYGGAAARELADQVVKINRIRTPARVPAGTRLKMPAAGAG